MRIDIILPYKELFSRNKASAVSLTVKNSAEFSKFKHDINVYGQFVEKPFPDLKFIGIKTSKFFHLGNNRSILINYIKLIKKKFFEKRIIEIHNRPYLFNLAIKKDIRASVTLHFHNDPREMRGAKSIAERELIAQNAASVYFVSEYIKDCFLEGLKKKYNNLYVIPNGIQRTIIKQPNKKKLIVFIGRLVPEKGCHLFVEAIREICKDYQDWEFKIIGTPKAGEKKLNLSYAKKLIDNFESLSDNTEYLGFIPNAEVKNILEKTSILVVPSVWQDPFPLTALEGICSGAAVIASNVGGMTEMLKDIGYLIDEIDEIKLKNAIKSLITNKNFLLDYQKKSWEKYRFNQTDIVRMQDKYREMIINDL